GWLGGYERRGRMKRRKVGQRDVTGCHRPAWVFLYFSRSQSCFREDDEAVLVLCVYTVPYKKSGGKNIWLISC
ncbi:hypothetical protein, partial [Nocardioides malaquae]|uniref:hypothetical protein n=1 Tax=Nocardioides malaquae TaxID=2773426 RepID=UPI001D0CF57D